MTTLPTLTPRAVIYIGRKRVAHLPRVLIEDQAVILRARCGIPLTRANGWVVEGFTETTGVPTCEACIEQEGEGR